MREKIRMLYLMKDESLCKDLADLWKMVLKLFELKSYYNIANEIMGQKK